MKRGHELVQHQKELRLARLAARRKHGENEDILINQQQWHQRLGSGLVNSAIMDRCFNAESLSYQEQGRIRSGLGLHRILLAQNDVEQTNLRNQQKIDALNKANERDYALRPTPRSSVSDSAPNWLREMVNRWFDWATKSWASKRSD